MHVYLYTMYHVFVCISCSLILSLILFLFCYIPLSVETKAQAAVMADKVKHRLEQLDDLEEGSVQETLNLSQRDYVKKIDDMNHHLSSAWMRDQRVHALKVAIQVGGDMSRCERESKESV